MHHSTGYPIVCQQTPGYSGIEGNKKAYLMAKSRAEKGDKQAKYQNSLVYIKENLAQAWNRELAK